MKTKIFLLLMLCISVFVWGQKEPIRRDTSAVISVSPPQFTGIVNFNRLFNDNSMNNLVNYLNSNVVYPVYKPECYSEGTGIIQFVVTSEGELTDFKIINSVCPVIDNELIRILKTTAGMWKPGFNNEKPEDMESEVSMMFVASSKNKKFPKEYFKKRASYYCSFGNKLFLSKHKPQKALRYYDKTVKYLPYETCPLLMRGLCKYELGDREGASIDWERINDIGKYDADLFIKSLSYLPGYEEMLKIVRK